MGCMAKHLGSPSFLKSGVEWKSSTCKQSECWEGPGRLVEAAWESLQLTQAAEPTGGLPTMDAPETRLLCEFWTFPPNKVGLDVSRFQQV